MADFSHIEYRVEEGIAHLVLNRPERLNALGKQTLLEIDSALDLAEQDQDVKVVLISGAGKAFSSGFDLKEQMEAAPKGDDVWWEILTRDFETTMRFWDFPKPTIAAVHGACLAGAFELTLACDFTIAAEDAVFGEPELKFGAGIVTMILPWMTGPKQAKEIILNGLDNIDAETARQLGFVTRVVKSGEQVPEAMRVARRLAVIDPNLVSVTKRAINHSFEARGMMKALKDALELDHAFESKGSPDKQAFMEVARKSGMKEAIRWRDARFK